MIRKIIGVVAGVVFWAIAFYALAILLSLAWPDYSAHARQWTTQQIFTFTAPMALCNLAFWIVSEAGAGWVAAKIAKNRATVWVLAGILGIYLAVLHFVLLWTHFPWWYNLGVVIPAVPAVLIGGTRAFTRPTRPG